MGNTSLGAARAKKNDEFYTQWLDIEREMNAYLEFDPDVFRDKVILLPCDDPEWSNFTKYFALHFMDFGIKKLISTSYAPRSNPAINEHKHQPTLFEIEDPKFDAEKSVVRGKKFILEPKDVSGDGKIDIDDIVWEYLQGDGDFRSAEITALRDEADMIITNPPFSLFREFMGWIIEGKKRFSMIGNENAVTYREIFPLIRDNKIWKGATGNTTDMVFRVPEDAEVRESDRLKAERLGYPRTQGDYTRLGNSCWFTNIEHGRRHEPMELMTMEDNLRFATHKIIREQGYPKYDNYDAIEVARTDAIPSDYSGVMGVPITFLNKYNPDQFEILGYDGDDELVTKTYGAKTRVVNGERKKSNTGTLGAVIREDDYGAGTYFDVGYPVRAVYKRIFIRHKKGNS